jgi:hypothetical protein
MSNGDEGRRAEPPRTKKFVSPEAEIVWPAIKALDEASKHELLGRLGDHLAVAEDDRTPQGQRIARAVGALREAHRLFEAEGNQGPLTVEVFRRLRVEHPEAGWPPDSSIRRWLGGSWNDALRRARLETCHVLATSQQDRGRLGSCPSEPLPAKEQAMKHREAPTPPQFATPHDTLRRQAAVSFLGRANQGGAGRQARRPQRRAARGRLPRSPGRPAQRRLRARLPGASARPHARRASAGHRGPARGSPARLWAP